jgi:hypothetical protein
MERAQSSKWIIENQAFLSFYGLAPSPFPHPPPLPLRMLHWRHTGSLRKRDNLLTGEGGGEPNHKTAKMPGPLYIKGTIA